MRTISTAGKKYNLPTTDMKHYYKQHFTFNFMVRVRECAYKFNELYVY